MGMYSARRFLINATIFKPFLELLSLLFKCHVDGSRALKLPTQRVDMRYAFVGVYRYVPRDEVELINYRFRMEQ